VRVQIAVPHRDDPDVGVAQEALRRCVECGAANSVCPTFLLLNDDRDSPRGRNRLIRDMLESDREPDRATVDHVDRCLSCNACTATCLARVDFMHLIDTARLHIERLHRRPLSQRAQRWVVATVLTRRVLFRGAMALARLVSPAKGLLPRPARVLVEHAVSAAALHPVGAAWKRPASIGHPSHPKVALFEGCVQEPLAPQINAAADRVLSRLGYRTIPVRYVGCCGALPYHMGKANEARAMAVGNIKAWHECIDREGLDWIVMTASGCGTMVKDYAHLLRNAPDHAQMAELVSRRTRDVTELASLHLGSFRPNPETSLRVAYHPPCSLQHAQKVRQQPQDVLRAAGFTLVRFSEPGLCCGSAGAYSMLQPEISDRLKRRKVTAIEASAPDVIATGNIGCLVQLASGTDVPVVHTIELIDWAMGGPEPVALSRRRTARVNGHE